MAEAAEKSVTAREFLRFSGEGDTRWQLIDGVMFAMAPPGDAHGTIAGNAYTEISRSCEGRPLCRGVVEAGISLDRFNHYKADVAATCKEPSGAPYVEERIFLGKVGSPTTHKDDLGVKVPRDIDIPSLRETWLIDNETRWVQVWRREGDASIVTMPLSGSATFESTLLDGLVELDRLYRNAGL